MSSRSRTTDDVLDDGRKKPVLDCLDAGARTAELTSSSTGRRSCATIGPVSTPPSTTKNGHTGLAYPLREDVLEGRPTGKRGEQRRVHVDHATGEALEEVRREEPHEPRADDERRPALDQPVAIAASRAERSGCPARSNVAVGTPASAARSSAGHRPGSRRRPRSRSHPGAARRAAPAGWNRCPRRARRHATGSGARPARRRRRGRSRPRDRGVACGEGTRRASSASAAGTTTRKPRPILNTLRISSSSTPRSASQPNTAGRGHDGARGAHRGRRGARAGGCPECRRRSRAPSRGRRRDCIARAPRSRRSPSAPAGRRARRPGRCRRARAAGGRA